VTTTLRRTTMQDGQALCRDDPDFRFPVSYTTTDGKIQTQFAAAVCERCPIRRPCLEDILANEGGSGANYRHGIYAGYTPDERFGIHRARARRAAARAEAEAC
jgi:hypothetical protein